MDSPLIQHPPTIAGTIGGTALVVLLQAGTNEIIHTALLAAIGAAVSFTVSMVLKWLVRKCRPDKTNTSLKKNKNGKV